MTLKPKSLFPYSMFPKSGKLSLDIAGPSQKGWRNRRDRATVHRPMGFSGAGRGRRRRWRTSVSRVMGLRVRIMVGIGWYRRTGGTSSPKSQTTKVPWQPLCLIAVLSRLRGVRVDITHGSARVAREGDNRGAERACDVIEGDLHWGNVGGVAFCGPGENMAADTAGGTVKDPCAGVARGCRIKRD